MKHIPKPQSILPRHIRLFAIVMAAAVALSPLIIYSIGCATVESQATDALRGSAAHRPYDPSSPLTASIELHPLDPSNPTLAHFPHLEQWLRDEGIPLTDVVTPFSGDGYDLVCLVPSSPNPRVENQAPTRMLVVDITSSLALVRQTTLTVSVGTIFASLTILSLGLKLTELLEKQDQCLDAFFANVSHQLKTPLTIIQGHLHFIDSEDHEIESAMASAKRACEQMGDLVEQILTISKSDAGALRPYITRTDVSELVYDALEDRRIEAQELGLTLTPIIDMTTIVYSDPHMVTGILSNLLSNALRHAFAVVMIQVSVKKDQDLIEILVINDGPCPNEEVLEHAFDRFYKGPNGSCGLGLPVARAYAQALGGTVTLSTDGNLTYAKATFVDLPQ